MATPQVFLNKFHHIRAYIQYDLDVRISKVLVFVKDLLKKVFCGSLLQTKRGMNSISAELRWKKGKF